MKPFNLQDALAGKPVITRDGRKVEQLFYFDKAKAELVDSRVVAYIKDYGIESYNEFGQWLEGTEAGIDLFMAPVTKKYYANLYATETRLPAIAGCYFDEQEAKCYGIGKNFIKTIEVEIDE